MGNELPGIRGTDKGGAGVREEGGEEEERMKG